MVIEPPFPSTPVEQEEEEVGEGWIVIRGGGYVNKKERKKGEKMQATIAGSACVHVHALSKKAHCVHNVHSQGN